MVYTSRHCGNLVFFIAKYHQTFLNLVLMWQVLLTCVCTYASEIFGEIVPITLFKRLVRLIYLDKLHSTYCDYEIVFPKIN